MGFFRSVLGAISGIICGFSDPVDKPQKQQYPLVYRPPTSPAATHQTQQRRPQQEAPHRPLGHHTPNSYPPSSYQPTQLHKPLPPLPTPHQTQRYTPQQETSYRTFNSYPPPSHQPAQPYNQWLPRPTSPPATHHAQQFRPQEEALHRPLDHYTSNSYPPPSRQPAQINKLWSPLVPIPTTAQATPQTQQQQQHKPQQGASHHAFGSHPPSHQPAQPHEQRPPPAHKPPTSTPQAQQQQPRPQKEASHRASSPQPPSRRPTQLHVVSDSLFEIPTERHTHLNDVKTKQQYPLSPLFLQDRHNDDDDTDDDDTDDDDTDIEDVDQQDEDYTSLRARANEEGDQMSQCFDRGHQAYANGDRAAAKELSNQGKRHRQEMERLHKEASDLIFKENNKDRRQGEIDLHGLYVKEAISFTNRAIEEALQRGDSEVHLIVGKGLHSAGGVAKVKPAIEERIQELQLVSRLDPTNAGVLIVKLDGPRLDADEVMD